MRNTFDSQFLWSHSEFYVTINDDFYNFSGWHMRKNLRFWMRSRSNIWTFLILTSNYALLGTNCYKNIGIFNGIMTWGKVKYDIPRISWKWPYRKLKAKPLMILWNTQKLNKIPNASKRPENLKKSRQKTSWNQINQKNFLGSFKLFPQFKNRFLAIFEIAKNGIWS